jgi:alkaline phosphatase D
MPLPTTYKDRIPMPLKETIQLEDYRMRYATHRTDEDLLLSHKLLPWIPVWDDHEIANNGWRGGSTSPIWMQLELTSWEQRVRNGLRAYFEWMPVRQVDADDSMRIWRNFKIGKLADLILLDTRYYDRDETDRPDLRDVEDRSIMGAKQEQWLYGQLEDSARRNVSWTVLGQQIQFSAINETAIGSSSKDLPLYWDGWSGYAANRRRVLEAMVSSNVSSPVVLTGDYHTLWTAELCWDDLAGYDHVSGEGSLGLELAVTSVTSRNGYGPLSYQQSLEVSRRLVRDNAFLKWTEGYYRGYFELELRTEALEARYFAVPDVSRRNTEEREIARWKSEAGSRRFARPFGKVTEGALQEVVKEWALEGIMGERR